MFGMIVVGGFPITPGAAVPAMLAADGVVADMPPIAVASIDAATSVGTADAATVDPPATGTGPCNGCAPGAVAAAAAAAAAGCAADETTGEVCPCPREATVDSVEAASASAAETSR
mmetsp:Transcript_25169/g.38281  ORF Transcript_25169/g.38281 Transcript_25169/m.38281 type:complete len:116 (+) Transcript_25169:106-453(+)